jgi:hypothetical protein
VRGQTVDVVSPGPLADGNDGKSKRPKRLAALLIGDEFHMPNFQASTINLELPLPFGGPPQPRPLSRGERGEIWGAGPRKEKGAQ